MTMLNGYDVTLCPIMTDGRSWFFIKNRKGEERAFLADDIQPYLQTGQPGMGWYKGFPWDDEKTEELYKPIAELWATVVARRTGIELEIPVTITIHDGVTLLPPMPDEVFIIDETGR